MKKIFLIISLAILILSIGSVSAAENFKGDNATNNSVSFVSNQSYQSNDFNNSVNSNHKSVSISGVVSDCITSKPFPGVSVK
ncbi:MAG: hypothetical protein Q8R66_09925 [Methanobacteriaceae archaeon]|nr:hypothetical protein [Methanobacteriaceae archaeon]